MFASSVKVDRWYSKRKITLWLTTDIMRFLKTSVYCVITKYSHSYIKDLHLDINITMGQVVIEARWDGFRYM